MYLVPTDGKQTKIGNWITMALFLLPIFFMFRFIIKENDLKEMEYEEQKIKRGNLWLISYIILSFVLLIIFILYKKDKL